MGERTGSHCIVCKDICSKYNIPELDRPPYLPILSPYDICLFPKFKNALEGTTFQTVDALK